MSDVKVGDRFEWTGDVPLDGTGLSHGDICRVTAINAFDPYATMSNETTGRDLGPGFSPQHHPWRRLPAHLQPLSPPSPSKGPEVGDVIRDPRLLRAGDRIEERLLTGTAYQGTVAEPWVNGHLYVKHDKLGTCCIYGDTFRDGRVTFLGYAATPAPPVVQRDAPRMKGAEFVSAAFDEADDFKLALAYALKPTPPDRRYIIGIDLGAGEPVVVPKPAPLPFKRHPQCRDAMAHRQPVMCVGCESLIAKATPWDPDAWDTQLPPPSAPVPRPYGDYSTYRHELPYDRRR